jgi:hypothetical protein
MTSFAVDGYSNKRRTAGRSIFSEGVRGSSSTMRQAAGTCVA